MPLPYIDTPRTEIDGNATYLTNGFRSARRGNLSALDSLENSFQTPSKDDDIIKALENQRRSSNGVNMSTPRAGSSGIGSKLSRSILNDRRNLPTAAPPKGEFTPMMKSATRNNFLRNLSAARTSGVPKTPAYLKEGYQSNRNTPGLPPMDMTDIYEEGATGSMAVDDVTPLPQVASSSAQSTPLPILPRRDGAGGIVDDGQNMLSLKEQENAINKLDKENFGLKLKIHYLQEQLDKAGPGYNNAALKENTELKVSKVTMQRDIARYKKNLHQAERDLEAYRLQLQELREKAKRRQAEETVQREMEWMRQEITTRETQVRDLKEELKSAREKDSEQVERLRDEIEDLEATIRDKDRQIEEGEDEIDILKANDGQESGAVADLEAELERAKKQMEELQEILDQAKSDARQASQAQEQAMQEKEQAEENLKELQDEMANKSFSTKGLNRQLEEKTAKLEEELNDLREEHGDLKEDYDAMTRRESMLQDQLEDLQHEHAAELESIRAESERAQRQVEQYQVERDEALNRLKQVLDDLDRKTDEKELLQSRHNALTDESGSLQRELAHAQASIRQLEEAVEDEKQRALDNSHDLRTQHREEVEHLQEEIDALQHEIEDKEGNFALEQDRWESTKRTLQSQKERAEEQAAGFKRTIEKIQDVELTSSGRETRLQEVIDSEKDRHLQEEAVLNRQVKDLNEDIVSKRQLIDDQRSELLTVREELRVSRREEEALKEKIQALEDEVVILQASLEEEKEYAKGQLKKGVSDQENQLQRAVNDRQTLRDQLANSNVELHNLRTSIAEVEAERDELQSQLKRVQTKGVGTSSFDQEKIELRKSKLRLESELEHLREEKATLTQARDSFEMELNAEIERATMEESRLANEIAQLQKKLHTTSGGRERELALSKSTVQRLEKRVLELETLWEQHQPADIENSTAVADISMLRRNLEEARKRENTLLQREADHKTSTRALKSRLSELERELHDVQMKKLETESPSRSPADKLQDELRSMRKKLSEAHKYLADLKAKNRELERTSIREEDRKDLHELLKSSTLEAESLALTLSERDARVSDLKSSLRRIREERGSALKKADAASQELDELQQRYDQLTEEMTGKGDRKGRHEKEIRGLGKEIIWLRARLKREEKFRRDLAWSKGLMELGERVRVACNEADLRMIAQMGVRAPEPKQLHDARRKLRTTGLAVIATVRMRRMSHEWSKARKLGDGLRRAKNELLRRRESLMRTEGSVGVK